MCEKERRLIRFLRKFFEGKTDAEIQQILEEVFVDKFLLLMPRQGGK